MEPQAHAHLEANTAAIKAALVHGGILSKKELAETILILEEEVAVTVVMKQPLSEVQQSPQLAQSTTVSFHLCSMMGWTEENAPSVRRNMACFVDDVKETTTHHLRGNRESTEVLLKVYLMSHYNQFYSFTLVRIVVNRNMPNCHFLY